MHRAMVAEVERRARAWHELAEDAALAPEQVLDFAVGMIESGVPMAKLADEISLVTGVDLPRAKLARYLNTLGENASEKLSHARARGAHGLAEGAILVADEPVLDQVEASRQRLRVSARQWTAERWNRSELGSQAGPQVSISVVNLHLAALQSAPPRVMAGEVLAIEAGDVATDLGAIGL